MSEAARSRRDEGRYEPAVAVPGREAAPFDPLAELARLVGQDDPFRNVFRPAAVPPGAAPQPPVASDRQAPIAAHQLAAHHDGGHDRSAGDLAHDGADDPAWADEGGEHGHHETYDEHGHADHHDGYYAAEQAAADEAGLADGHLAPGVAAATLPDMWARGGEGVPPAIDHGPGPVALDSSRSAARRPMAVLAAVLLLTGGGLGASFLAKGGSTSGTASVASGHGAPTIMAASGPTKIKVDDGSATAPEDQDAALLNKSANLSSGPVKIVSSQEQPADLAQLPKSDLAEGARPLPPPVPSPFPEPKKVKTFVVHPDGSMLSGDAGPMASSAVAAAAPASGDTPAALAATPKTVARGGTTPKVAAEPSIASLSSDPALADPASTAAVATVAPPKPARPSPAAGGGYGVQLASSPVEADANAAFARLKKKYPAQLGSYTATVHKAETGDKPVYRVRVGGMSQDEAKALCAQLQTAGGACLVMHN